jgi:hypothetical protein
MRFTGLGLDACVVKVPTNVINGPTFFTHPGEDLLNHLGFVREDLITSFSATLVLVDISIAVWRMA